VFHEAKKVSVTFCQPAPLKCHVLFEWPLRSVYQHVDFIKGSSVCDIVNCLDGKGKRLCDDMKKVFVLKKCDYEKEKKISFFLFS